MVKRSGAFMEKDTYEDNLNAMGEAERILPTKQDKIRLRPNNYAIIIPILKDDISLHLPIVKREGIKGTTVREYKYEPNFTIEKTTKSIIIYLRKRILRIVEKPEDVEKANQEMTDLLIERAQKFEIEHPDLKLDLMNTRWKTREVGIKETALNKIDKRLRMKNTIFKKVYSKEVEFQGNFADPIFIKQFIKNRTIEDWQPELKKSMDFIITQQEQFAKNLATHLEVLTAMKEYLKPKESSYQRLRNFILRLKK
jgi:hypothetical protein